MFGLIESILLSRFLIFIILMVMLLAVTSWAFRTGDFPGYMLGWLVGIFFIIIYRTVTGGDSPEPEVIEEAAEAIESPDRALTLLAVMIPSVMGIIGGFTLLFFLRNLSGTRAGRSLTIATLTAAILIVMFFLATTGEYTSRILGIFALAFCIGALTKVIIGGPLTGRPTPRGPSGGGQPPSAQINATQDRFDRLRRRIERRE